MCFAPRGANCGSDDGTRALRPCATAASDKLARLSKVRPELQTVAGSPLWQAVIISFGVVLVLFEVVRGWRLGLLRQLVRVAALAAALVGCSCKTSGFCFSTRSSPNRIQ